jgi:hypothetical protein
VWCERETGSGSRDLDIKEREIELKGKEVKERKKGKGEKGQITGHGSQSSEEQLKKLKNEVVRM